MEVYIEYVIIDNLIINFLLLWSTMKIMGFKINFYMLFVSAMLGTIIACLLPLISLSSGLTALIKAITGVLMVLIIHKFAYIKEFIISFIIFVSLTFLMGGACYAIIILLGGTFENVTLGKYDTIVPVSIIIATCFIYAFLVFRLTKFIYRKKDMLPYIGEAEIELNGSMYRFKTYLDSGNRLYDKKSGSPVIILSAFALERFVSSDEIAKLIFLENNSTFKDVHYLEYTTVEGKAKKMVVFVPKKITIITKDKKKQYENICVGVTFKKFNDAINFDCLLHPALV